MMRVCKNRLVVTWVLSLIVGLSIPAAGQTSIADSTTAKEKPCFMCFYERSSYPERIVTPYANFLLGFTTFQDYRSSALGVAFESRGGILLGRSMLLGTGISILTIDGYEMGAVIPLEVGYRSKNERFDFVTSLGSSYLLGGNNFVGVDDQRSGKTISADIYWRPTISAKRLRFVVAAGGMMYDFGDAIVSNCRTCGFSTGPRYTFRLRGGFGF